MNTIYPSTKANQMAVVSQLATHLPVSLETINVVVTALCVTINVIAYTISGLPTVLYWCVDNVPSVIY